MGPFLIGRWSEAPSLIAGGCMRLQRRLDLFEFGHSRLSEILFPYMFFQKHFIKMELKHDVFKNISLLKVPI